MSWRATEKRWRRVERSTPPTEIVPAAQLPTGTDTELWTVWAEAANMLDASKCDWRMLQQIEGLLSSLSIELDRATAAQAALSPHATMGLQADSDLRFLQSSLAWVRRHEYDALDSELQIQLDTALQCAMGTLERLERSQYQTRSLSFRGRGPGDGA